jgi:hypothetical protein
MGIETTTVYACDKCSASSYSREGYSIFPGLTIYREVDRVDTIDQKLLCPKCTTFLEKWLS